MASKNSTAKFQARRPNKLRCEEVPCINLDHVFRVLRENRFAGIRWVSNDRRGVIGQGGFENLGSQLSLNFRFGGSPQQESLTLHVIHTSNGVTSKRRRVSCPNCGKHISSIYFVNTYWACRTCQGLAYASQLKTATEDLEEKWYRANLQLKLPRRPGEHRKSYEARVRKAQETLDSMSHYPRVGVGGPPASPTIEAEYWAGAE